MSTHRILRLVVLLLLAALIAGGVYFIFTHEHDPHRIGLDARAWVSRHRLIAPAALIAVYVLLSLAMLPVWWLQVTAGYAFGLLVGVAYCEIAATIGAALTVALSHWLAGEWIHEKIESKKAKLRRLDEIMGSNGLLVVMAVRLTHVLPFALSNYFFGLTRITVGDTAAGTFFGGLPALAVYVTLGAHRRLLRDWRYWTAMAAINALLLLPLFIRYRRQIAKVVQSEPQSPQS